MALYPQACIPASRVRRGAGRLRGTAALLAATLAAAVLLPAPQALGQTVQAVANRVSQTWYRAYLGYPGDLTDANNPLPAGLRNPLSTHSGDQRNNGQADWTAARTNYISLMNGFGLTTTIANLPTYYNTVASLTGSTRPQDIYIVGAHYDSVGNPGADDNASGTAALLEAARVLSQFQFQATILFIAFDQEEDGLLGSWAYAADADVHNDNILGMVSADMIAWNNPGDPNRARLYSGNTPIKTALGTAIETYGGLSVTKYGVAYNSDQWPFEYHGFPSCLLIESYSGTPQNPYYHQPGDNVDSAGYLDYAFATNMTRGLVGWLAEEAGLVSSSGWATRWNSATGAWSDANRWGAGIPDGNTNANITNGGTVTVASADALCYRLYLGAGSTQAGTLSLEEGSLLCASGYARIAAGGTLDLGGGALVSADSNSPVDVDSAGLILVSSGDYALGDVLSTDPNLLLGTVEVEAGATLTVDRLVQDEVIVSGTLVIGGSDDAGGESLGVSSASAARSTAVPAWLAALRERAGSSQTSQPVPEPATLALVALGLAALARRRSHG